MGTPVEPDRQVALWPRVDAVVVGVAQLEDECVDVGADAGELDPVVGATVDGSRRANNTPLGA